jgi:hypothetical protein
MANDIVDDCIRQRLAALGVSEFPEPDASHARRQNLIDFAQKHSGKCAAAEVMKFISTCEEGNPGSINRHDGGTAYLTFANPQNDSKTFWIMSPHEFKPYNQFNQFREFDNE